jgi:hypothetical protein
MNFITKIFLDFYIFLKMLILGSCSLISEMCCFVQPIKSKKKTKNLHKLKTQLNMRLIILTLLQVP